MFLMFGYSVQEIMIEKDSLENLINHLVDPIANNT